MSMNYGNIKLHIQSPQLHKYQNLTKHQPNDNPGEDTSNDVSEIGTLSDLTNPETTSTLTRNTCHVNVVTSTTPTTPARSTNSVPAVISNAASTSTLPSNIAGALSLPVKSSTFDYLYEFSETRKVLEEFFKCPSNDEKPLEVSSDIDSIVS